MITTPEALADIGVNELDRTMDQLATLVARLLGSEIGLVSLVDDHRQFFPGQYGLPAPLSELRQTPLEQSMCRQVVVSADVVQIDHAADDVAWVDHGARVVLGVESYLGVPLTDEDGRVLGSLCAINMSERRWTTADRQNLTDLAAGASSALRARIASTAVGRASARLQLVADTSRVLQETFEVEPLLVSLLEILVPRLSDRAAIVLTGNGDVTGHNIEAAAAMARTLGAFRCFAFDHRQPAEVLERLDSMTSYLLGVHLATCQHAVLEPLPAGTASWRATIANAGHLPPLLVLPDGSGSFVGIHTDPLVGVRVQGERHALEVDIPSGSVLVLSTDGLIERRRETIDVGLDRLRDAASTISSRTSAERFAAALLAAVEPDGTDDVALLCIRIGTAAPTAG
ncbi:MAG: putative sensor protein [Ilumatobacteraceae bacterium]|nr:putative sensor protein [Ilumatobacteraceae bacterium]